MRLQPSALDFTPVIELSEFSAYVMHQDSATRTTAGNTENSMAGINNGTPIAAVSSSLSHAVLLVFEKNVTGQ